MKIVYSEYVNRQSSATRLSEQLIIASGKAWCNQNPSEGRWIGGVKRNSTESYSKPLTKELVSTLIQSLIQFYQEKNLGYMLCLNVTKHPLRKKIVKLLWQKYCVRQMGYPARQLTFSFISFFIFSNSLFFWHISSQSSAIFVFKWDN